MTAIAPAPRGRAALLAVLVLLAAWSAPGAALAAPDRSGHERIAEATLFERHNLAREDPAAYGQDPSTAVDPLWWSEYVAEIARDWADTMARTGDYGPNPNLAAELPDAGATQTFGTVTGVPSEAFPDYVAAAERVVELIMNSGFFRPNLMGAATTHVGIGAAIDDDGTLWVSAVYRLPDPGAPVTETYPHPLPDPLPPIGETPDEPAAADPEDLEEETSDEPPPAQDVTPACPTDLPAARFSDVTRPAAERSVSCLVWWGIASGTSPTTYTPHLEVRRDQMASFVARAIERSGGRLPPAAGQPFDDVPSSLAHADAVNRLAAQGILSGSGGTFRPGESLSRGEMTRTLVRAYEYRTGRAAPAPTRQWFTDAAGTAFAQSINQSAEAGWSAGKGDGTFRPDDGVRRDQMAMFLARWLGTLVEEGDATPPAS
ncbi:MAG: S-layer homology domain-containing protein [Egicoccus sp.]